MAKLFHRLAERVVDHVRMIDATVLATRILPPIEQIGEQVAGGEAASIDLLLQPLEVFVNQQTLLRSVVVKPIKQVVELAAGQANAKMITGDRFDRVAFVQDDRVVVGQQCHALPCEAPCR